MIVALTLEYINYFGDSVTLYLPTYASMAECDWWRDWFVGMLEHDHASNISGACKALK